MKLVSVRSLTRPQITFTMTVHQQPSIINHVFIKVIKSEINYFTFNFNKFAKVMFKVITVIYLGSTDLSTAPTLTKRIFSKRLKKPRSLAALL